MIKEERVTLSCEDMRPIVLGKVKTNTKRFVFDLSALMDEYGSGGTAELWFRRPDDLAATKQQLQLEGKTAIWDITKEATAQRGEGEAQFFYYPGEKGLVKTNIFKAIVLRDIYT